MGVRALTPLRFGIIGDLIPCVTGKVDDHTIGYLWNRHPPLDAVSNIIEDTLYFNGDSRGNFT